MSDRGFRLARSCTEPGNNVASMKTRTVISEKRRETYKVHTHWHQREEEYERREWPALAIQRKRTQARKCCKSIGVRR